MPSSGGQTCALDRKSTRLNSSHGSISYAVFCLKTKIIINPNILNMTTYKSSYLQWKKHINNGNKEYHMLVKTDPYGQVMSGIFFFFLCDRRPHSSYNFPKDTIFN